MNIVDLLILGILVVGLINGYRKGLLRSVMSIAGSLLGLLLAYRYYEIPVRWLNESIGATEKLSEFFKSYLVLPQKVSGISFSAPSLPDMTEHLDKITISESLREQLMVYMQKLQSGLALEVPVSLGDIIHEYLGVVVINAVVFLVMWFVISKAFVLVSLFLTKATKGTLLGGMNRLAGMVLGLCLSSLTLAILIGIINPLLGTAEMAEASLLSAVIETIGEAKLVPYFTSIYTFISTTFIDLILL